MKAAFDYVGSGGKLAPFLKGLRLVNEVTGWFFNIMYSIIVITIGCVVLMLCKISLLKHAAVKIKHSPDELSESSNILLQPHWAILFSVLLLFGSSAAVFTPGKGYVHYFIFLIIPLCSAVSICLYQYYHINGSIINMKHYAIFMLILAASQISHNHKYFFGQELVNKFKQEYTAFNNDEVVSVISSYTSPGDKMSIWGWSFSYYVKSNLVMATRTPMDVFNSGHFKSLQSYFSASYARELEQSKPKIILDTVTPGQFPFIDRAKKRGMHNFPEISRIVARDYFMVQTIKGINVYVLKDKTQNNHKITLGI
ncbi:hypothetical protein [Geobacter sp. OR-1]|uniref:hypothetical protein n=1 Tax=Geobacter sp. OR-1 TaxID=1266765 RepID=UPI001269B45A|nr:hypothetical protein [Geobacter sp. OR-1]